MIPSSVKCGCGRSLVFALVGLLPLLLATACGVAAQEGQDGQDDLGGEPPEREAAASKAAPPAERVSLHATYDTQPAIASDVDGVPWAAWVGHAKGEDKVHVARQEGGRWSKPVAVTARGGDYVRPVAAKPRKATGPDATVEEAAELLLEEGGESGGISASGGGEERLQVLAHDLVEHGAFRLAGRVPKGREGRMAVVPAGGVARCGHATGSLQPSVVGRHRFE